MPITGIHNAVWKCVIFVQDFLLWHFSCQPSFHHPPKTARVITEVLKRRLPQTVPTRWNFKSDVVNSVSEHWISHIECFEKMQTRQLFSLHQDSYGFWRTVTFYSVLSFCIQWSNLWIYSVKSSGKMSTPLKVGICMGLLQMFSDSAAYSLQFVYFFFVKVCFTI